MDVEGNIIMDLSNMECVLIEFEDIFLYGNHYVNVTLGLAVISIQFLTILVII